MPIQAPPDTSGTRTPYGPVAIVSPTPSTTDDPTAVGYVSVPMSVYRSKTASTAETDLQTSTGTAITAVTPDATTGACEWQGPPGYAGVMWVADPATGRRWPVHPSDYSGPNTGQTLVTWDTLTGRPFVVAAADTVQGARDAIGAITLGQVTATQVGLGNVNNTSDASKPVSTAQAAAISAAQTAAQTYSTNRLNHSGTQAASTVDFTNADQITAFRAAVLAVTGSGSVTPPPPPPTATDIPTAVDASGTGSGTAGPYTITVSWQPPTDTGGKTVAGYNVYRDNPDWTTPTPLLATDRSYVLTNFSTGYPYKTGVQTVFSDGTKSAWVYAPTVTFAAAPTTGGGTTGTTGSAPMAYPTHGIGMYAKIYNDSSVRSVSSLPSNVNNLRLAFWFGNPINPAGTGSDGANFGTRLQALRARGVRIIASLGGGGNTLDITQTQSIVTQLMSFSNNVCPLDGWDIDLEGPSMNSNAIVSIAQSMRTSRGANWITTMAPNGTTIGSYIPVAQALNNAGLLSAAGQQFYDAPVDDAAMKNKLLQWVQAGLPISKYELGMMSPPTNYAPDSYYWDTATQVARLNSAKTAYPALGGAYYWEANRTGQDAFASQVGSIINQW